MTTNVPEKMKVIEVPQPGGADVLVFGERPTPEPDSEEVLIRVAGAGMNRAHIMQREGKYPPPPGASDLLGLEVSGTVIALGKDTENLSIGNKVCALVAGGGYAEYCLAPASSCLPVPDSLDIVEAGAVPETFFTVWTNVFTRGNLSKGESILIHGGSSGIGTTAIQLAKAFGATVLTTAGSDKKCNRSIELGADIAINYKEKDFVEEVLDITSGKGVDVILDMVGGSYVPRNLKCLAMEGRAVIIATQGGLKSEINILPIMMKRLTLTGSTLRGRSIEQKAAIADELREKVWPLLENNTVYPVIDSVFPVEQVKEAHLRMESGQHIGKIVLAFN